MDESQCSLYRKGYQFLKVAVELTCHVSQRKLRFVRLRSKCSLSTTGRISIRLSLGFLK